MRQLSCCIEAANSVLCSEFQDPPALERPARLPYPQWAMWVEMIRCARSFSVDYLCRFVALPSQLPGLHHSVPR